MQNDSSATQPSTDAPVIKVIGLGDAGANIAAALTGADAVKVLAANTDAASAARLGGVDTVVFGRQTTRGLSAGGDPERGRAAAEEDAAKFSAACAGGSLIFVIAGLGGGTGTGAAPVVARAARQGGGLVLALAVMPFEFEGTKRLRTAQAGLAALKREADAVIVMPNERLQHLLAEGAGAGDGFRALNTLLADGVRAIARLLNTRGLINLDFASLAAALSGQHGESALATAEAGGLDRAKEVVGKLLAHPLLRGGEALRTADSILVCLSGGPGFSFGDVNAVMRELNGRFENGNLTMGASIDPALGDRISVTILATARGEAPGTEAPAATPLAKPAERPVQPAPLGIDTEFIHKLEPPARPRRGVRPPPPDFSPEQQQQIISRATRPGGRRRRHPDLQQQLPLEIVSKGRFEKSEPTLHHGEDLDVPTFIRRGLLLN